MKAVKVVYQQYLKSLVDNLAPFQEVIRRLAEIDCLFSMANFSIRFNCWFFLIFFSCGLTRTGCKPNIRDEIGIHALEARHPLLEEFSSTPHVPNDIELGSSKRCMILTSANMSGVYLLLRPTTRLNSYRQIFVCKVRFFYIFTKQTDCKSKNGSHARRACPSWLLCSCDFLFFRRL